MTHLHKLREYQCPVPHGKRLFQHLCYPAQLAAAPLQRLLLAQIVGRMVGHLFQLEQQTQYQPSPLHSLAPFHAGNRLFDYPCVKKLLLFGKGTVNDHLILLRQI